MSVDEIDKRISALKNSLQNKIKSWTHWIRIHFITVNFSSLLQFQYALVRLCTNMWLCIYNKSNKTCLGFLLFFVFLTGSLWHAVSFLVVTSRFYLETLKKTVFSFRIYTRMEMRLYRIDLS